VEGAIENPELMQNNDTNDSDGQSRQSKSAVQHDSTLHHAGAQSDSSAKAGELEDSVVSRRSPNYSSSKAGELEDSLISRRSPSYSANSPDYSASPESRSPDQAVINDNDNLSSVALSPPQSLSPGLLPSPTVHHPVMHRGMSFLGSVAAPEEEKSANSKKAKADSKEKHPGTKKKKKESGSDRAVESARDRESARDKGSDCFAESGQHFRVHGESQSQGGMPLPATAWTAPGSHDPNGANVYSLQDLLQSDASLAFQPNEGGVARLMFAPNVNGGGEGDGEVKLEILAVDLSFLYYYLICLSICSIG
jgi:hypothetical protein